MGKQVDRIAIMRQRVRGGVGLSLHQSETLLEEYDMATKQIAALRQREDERIDEIRAYQADYATMRTEIDALRQQVADLTGRAERAESEYDALTAEYNALLDGGDPGGKLRTQLSELRRDYAVACQNTRAALVNQQRWQQEAEAAAVQRENDNMEWASALGALQQEAEAARAEVARLREALAEIRDYNYIPQYDSGVEYIDFVCDTVTEALAPAAHSEPEAGDELPLPPVLKVEIVRCEHCAGTGHAENYEGDQDWCPHCAGTGVIEIS